MLRERLRLRFALIDRSPLFSTFQNDPVISKVLHTFIQHLPESVNVIRKMISEKKWEDAAGACHRLKGTSSGYGYPLLAELVAQLEDVLRDSVTPDPQKIAILVASLGRMEIEYY